MTLHIPWSRGWRLRAGLTLSALGLCPLAQSATPATTATATAKAVTTSASASSPADAATLKAFGHREGLGRLTQDVVARLARDPRLAEFFKGVDQPKLAASLADQFCVLLGGPCHYQGADMKAAHEGMDIRQREFNALVELLQQAMDAQGVPFAAQNRLLARLAPMHRDMVVAP